MTAPEIPVRLHSKAALRRELAARNDEVRRLTERIRTLESQAHRDTAVMDSMRDEITEMRRVVATAHAERRAAKADMLRTRDELDQLRREHGVVVAQRDGREKALRDLVAAEAEGRPAWACTDRAGCARTHDAARKWWQLMNETLVPSWVPSSLRSEDGAA